MKDVQEESMKWHITETRSCLVVDERLFVSLHESVHLISWNVYKAYHKEKAGHYQTNPVRIEHTQQRT